MSSTTDTEQRFAYLLSPEFEIVNTAGKPLTGGWIEVYIHGTRDKYYCLSDFDGTLHPFQIPLDSLGSNIVLASPTHAYDIYIYNKFGSLVMSRYNVVPATNSPDAVADVVVIDSPDETINVTIDGGSNWHLEVNTDLIATASGLAEVSGALTEVSGALLNKKDKQEALSFEGAATKTVKNISQDDNGVITVEYEDIDLPQQVPNVNIISPSGTLDITSTTDPATNTKTFKIDVHKSNMDYFEGYYGRARYEDRPSDTVAAFTTYVDQWREYRYQGDFIANSWQDQDNTTFLLNSGLYLITASIRYKMTDASVKNKEEYVRIATGAFNGLENGTQLKDWSNEAALNENTIQLSFVRSVDDDEDYDNLRGNHTLYFAPYLPYGVNYAEIDHLQIVKLDSIVTYHGGPGPSYKPGYGIEIQDGVISVATGDVVTNNYFETVVSSINTEINELTTVINNVSGDITNLNESVTNLIGATGDYATKDYVDEAVSGLENYSAGQYISIEDHIISVTGLQPEGDYATVEQLEVVSGDVNNLTEIVNNITNVTGDFATVEYVDNRIATAAGDVYEAGQYVSIIDNTISVTGLQPAGDYATEQYVDEAVAAVTGSFEQVQSDWTQTDDTKVDYIKHKPRQVNLVAGDNITIEQDGLDVIISASDPGDTYTAGQYISIQNNTIAATGLQPAGNYLTPADLNGYATEQYVDDAVAAVTGQPVAQVNSDWLATSGVAEILNKPDVFQLIAGDNIDITPSGNDLVISASSDVTKAYVDEQIDAVSAAIPTLPQEEEVEFEELNLSDYALASAIPDVSDFATKAEVQAATGMIPDVSNFATNDDVQYVQEQVDQLVAATGYYLQASDLAGYATEQDLSNAIDTATGMIPEYTASSGVKLEDNNISLDDPIGVVAGQNITFTASGDDIIISSNAATPSDIQNVQAQIDDLVAATGDYLQESDLQGYVTEQDLSNAIDVATGMIPDISDLATKTEVAEVDAKVDAVSAAIPTLPSEEDVEFEEVDLSAYALASAVPDITQLETDVANLVAATGDYATEQYVDEAVAAATGAIPEYTATSGIKLEDNTFSLDEPIGVLAGDNITFTASGDDIIISSDLTNYALASAVPQIELNNNDQVTAINGHELAGGSAEDDEFYAEYGVTTLAEVNTAFAAGKKVFCTWGAMILTCVDSTNAYWKFASTIFTDPTPKYYVVTLDSDGWSYSVESAQSVPSSTSSDKDKVLTVDSTGTPVWAESQGNTYTAGSGIDIANDTISLDNPVNLVAGDNVAITVSGDDVVISASGGGSNYTAGAGIDITNDVISIDNTVALKNDIPYVSRGKGIDISTNRVEGHIVHTYSVDDTVITTAATAVNLSKANFEIDNNGQAYKLSNSTEQVTYDITSASKGGTFDGTIKLNVGDTITITNCPVTNEQMYVRLDVRDGFNVASYTGPVTAGSDITLTVERDTDLTGTFDIQVLSFTDFQTYSLTDSDCTFDNIVTSREEYALASAIPLIEVNSNDQVTAIDGHTLAGGGSNYTAGDYVDITGNVISVTGLDNSNTFFATVGSTTWQTVKDAYDAGKRIFAVTSRKSILPLAEYYSTRFYFSSTVRRAGMANTSPSYITYVLYSDNDWTDRSSSLQADWNETTTGAASYIKNKPSIPTVELNSNDQVTAIDGHELAGGGSAYTAGNGIDITNDEISIDNTVALKSEIPTLPTEEEVDFEEVDLSDYALASAIPDTSDMATQTWVGQQGYLTSVPAIYVTDSELNSAVSGLATKVEVGNKQNTLTGITDVQLVQSLPAEPVATVLYLIPEA